MDLSLSKKLLHELIHSGQNVSGIYSYNDASPMPLNWGEIIPLLLLPNEDPPHQHRYMILSTPHRRYQQAVAMVPELVNLGRALRGWADEQFDVCVAVLVSGDLSHTHQATGPYGYSNASAPFDHAVGQWAQAHGSCGLLLDRARGLQPIMAKACGFTGYVIWEGMRRSSRLRTTTTSSKPQANHLRHCRSPRTTDSGYSFDNATVYVNRNVTYYGMMAATFLSSSEHDGSRDFHDDLSGSET